MKSDFEIHPYKGMGTLTFGMSSAEITRIVGKADDFELDDDNELREFRRGNGFQAVFRDGGNSLVELGFSSNVIELNFSGIDIFLENEADVIERIAKIDGKPYSAYGFLVFMNIGLTLSGFHHQDDAAKGVTIFNKGRWDAMKRDLKLWRG